MATDAEALLGLIEKGVPLERIVELITPPAVMQALDRCAALRRFDERIFAVAAADLDDEARGAFARVVSHPEVEPLGGGTYRVRDAACDRRLEDWLSQTGPKGLPEIPAWMRDLGRRMVAYFDAPETRDEMEAVYHAFATDPAEATDRLTSMFAVADEAFDLARCIDLLDLGEHRVKLGGPDLRATLNRLRARVKARARWSDAWYRTASYVPPPAAVAAVDRLLEGPDRRVLEVVGPDGMGKTTLIRWLIARRCVPEGYACAAIDLADLGDPLLAIEEPWLLLIEIARQLDPQLPDAPFRRLLRTYEAHGARLRWLSAGRGAAAMSARPPESADERRRLALTAHGRFYDALDSVDSPILIVVDALETIIPPGSALSHRRADASDHRLGALSEELAELARGSRRLVLGTSREDIAAAALLGADAPSEVFRLAPLTRVEAAEYLRRRSRTALDPLRVEAAIRAGNGVPMRLAAIADAFKRGMHVTPDDLDAIAEQGEAGIASLVLRRLDPTVRELVHHGVAPRVLDLGFFDDVLAPFVAETHAFDSDGSRDLWRDLRDFAATSSWATLAGPDAIRFHPLLAGPMRRALRGTPEGARLHEAAETFFVARAESDPQSWGTWMSEAVYHRFERDGDGAVAYWRQLMRDAGHRHARHADRLAYELLRIGAAAEAEGRPLSDDLAREAWLMRAWANVRLARSAPGEPRGHDGWERARCALEELRDHGALTGRTRAGATALTAALQARDGSGSQAVALLRGGLSSATTAEDELSLRFELAQALETVAPDDALAEYRLARDLAQRVGGFPDVITIGRLTARHLTRRDRYETARQVCQTTIDEVSRGTWTHADLVLLNAELCLRGGTPSAAAITLDALDDFEDLPASMTHRAGLLRAEAALATWQPEHAVRILDVMYERAVAERTRADDADLELRLAEIRDLRGQARVRLIEGRSGLDDMQWALVGYEAAGLSSRVHGCLGRMAEVQLRYLDDVRAAGFTLDRADIAPQPIGPLEELPVHLRRIEWLDRSGIPARLHDEIEHLLTELEAAQAPPRDFIATAIEGLAIQSDPRPARYARLLVDHVARVETVGGRLLLVQQLRRCGELPSVPRGLGAELDRLTSPEGGFEQLASNARDRAVLAMASADVARVFGARDEGARRASVARDALLQDGMEPYAARRLQVGLERFGVDATGIGPHARGTEPRTHPQSDAALLIQTGLRLLRGDQVEPEHVDALLTNAQDLLEPVDPENQLLAALHRARSEFARSVSDTTGARLHGTRAAVLRERLRPPDEREATPPAPSRDPILRLDLQTPPRRFGPEPPATPSPSRRVLGGRLGRLLAEPDPSAVEEIVAWLASDLRGWVTTAAGALFDDHPADHATDAAAITICVSSADIRVQALPWELAVDAAPTALRARIDRVQRTMPSVRAVDGGVSAERRVTVFTQPGQTAGATEALGATVTVPVDERYRGAGWDVEVADTFAPDELAEIVSDRRPQVIHLACPLVYSGGTAFVDVGVPGARGLYPEHQMLTASQLHRAAMSPSTEAPPIFILDPPGLTATTETVRQLLLRNLFAAELFALSASPVLCTGLVRYGARDNLADTIVRGLHAALDAQDTAAALRAVSRSAGAGTPFGYRGTALFLPVTAPA